VARGLGLGLAIIGLLAILSEQFRSRKDVWAADKRIAFRHGCALVDVVALGIGAEDNVTIVPDLDNLAALAAQYERAILRERLGNQVVYAVEENGRYYLHEPAATAEPSVQLPRAVPLAPTPRPAHTKPAGKARILKPIGALVTLVVAVSVVTSFTAANVVPASNVGSSLQARQIAQLTPARCAGIALTNLVIASGPTVTGTAANDLILGSNASGTITFNGAGGSDCIVAGGTSSTTNSIDGGGGSGDVCIGGPSAKKNTFAHCEATY
jgi:hypothetical protein